MAQNQVGNEQGFVDKRGANRAGSTADYITTNTNYDDINAMRTRLAAAAPGTYTTARLEQMTDNDMRFALRSIDDPTSI